MSNYRAGDVIRLNRIANGMTQEELSDGICSVQTLHRIENGKTGVKKDTYRYLMERMNRISEKNYAVCVGKDMELLEERSLLEAAVARYDYESADKYMKLLREKADDNLVTKQYVLKAEAIMDFQKHRIDAKELVERMRCVVQMTVPRYEEYLETEYPFTEQEISYLMSLANALCRIEEYDKGMKIYRMLLRCLKLEYMCGSDKTYMQAAIIQNCARVYSLTGEYRKAAVLCRDCLGLFQKCNDGASTAVVMGFMTWNMLKAMEQEEDERQKEGEMAEVKGIMRQAYYIAAARRDVNIMKIVKEQYEGHFGKLL